jgi:thymidylate synthase
MVLLPIFVYLSNITNMPHMCFHAETLDDLLYDVFKELLARPFDVKPSRGASSEIIAASLKLQNPRARLSRTETKGTLFSGLGELLWYMSGKNELAFIQHYISKYSLESEDEQSVYGGYGPRLFNHRKSINQVGNILNLLRKNESTRRAVIQLLDAEDIIFHHKEIPCTCALQFFIRENKLHMFTMMRSNDAFIGLPHDIFTFTMIQEIIARALNIEVGIYNHAVGSLHLYESHKDKAEAYLSEGFQPTNICMPPMPIGDPFPAIEILLHEEAEIRNKARINTFFYKIDPYWLDLIRLLQIHSLYKQNKPDEIQKVKNELSVNNYSVFVDEKISLLKKKDNKETK